MNKQVKIKIIIFIFFSIVFCIPILQILTGGHYAPQLDGFMIHATKPKLTFTSWRKTEFQAQYESWFNEEFSFRNYFVRLYDQLYFSAFRIPKAKDVIVGKHQYIYEQAYINEYFGLSFIGDSAIDREMKIAKILSDTLAKRRIKLMIVFAPGKATFFPEFLPVKYKNFTRKRTNYQCFIEKCIQYHINYLDFNSCFLKLKNKTKYPIYSNVGIHWTQYGAMLALDSLLKYIDNLMNIKLTKMVITGYDVRSKAQFTDDDLAVGMNLIFEIPHPDFAYPKIDFIEDNNTVKPTVLVIGDSYYWNMFATGLSGRFFKETGFWYYNTDANYYNKPVVPVISLDVKKEIEKQDLIILMSTDANLYKFSWGFIENLAKAYGIKDIK